MMRWMKNKINAPYVSAFLFTLFSLAVFLITTPTLSAAGDLNIAEYLASSKIEPGFFFISPALASVLRFLNRIYTASWWSLFSVMVMFGGLFVFLWFINKRFARQEGIARWLLNGLFVLFFWELLLKYEINFTQTTVIAALAANLLILDCCYEKRGNKKGSVIKLIFAAFLLLLAGSIRWKALILMVPFTFMCLLYFFLFPYTSSNLFAAVKHSFSEKKRLFLLMGMTALVVISSYGIHKLYGNLNPDLGEYVKANALREEICDYKDCYPDYNENTMQMYQELGIKQSWIDMVYGFITGDVNHFSSADLQKMADLKQSSHMKVSNFTSSLKEHTLLWITLIVFLIFLTFLNGRKNCYLPFLGCILAFILCGLYFVAIGRIAWRVTNGCILACVLSFVAMSAYQISEVPLRRFNLTEKTGLLAVTVIFFLVGCVAVYSEKEISFPRARITDQGRADMLAYIASHPDTFYLDIEDMIRYYDAYNLWASHEPEYLDNSISLIAHFIIGEKETLEESGIEDMISDMLIRPDIQVRYSSPYSNGILYRYLKDYYEECVSVSVVDQCGGTRFLRYAEPVIANNVKNDKSVISLDFEMRDEFPEDNSILAAVSLSCNLDPKYRDIYCDYFLNIEDHATGAVYSYGLAKKEEGCSGELLWMDGTWEIDDLSVSLLGANAEGSYDILANVTEDFLASGIEEYESVKGSEWIK